MSGTTLTATICLTSCNNVYGPYLTPDKKCVSTCDNTLYLKNDPSMKCLCEGLYYYDEQNIMTCIDTNIIDCKSNTSPYIISKANSQECLKTCNGILSLNEDICYENTYDCSNDANSKVITLNNGQKKCNCKYKYHYINSSPTNRIKECLGENDDCPSGELYIPETNGCDSNCNDPFIYKFNGQFCFRSCPDNSNIDNSNHICTCEHNWYSLSNQIFICLQVDECPKTHPLKEVSTKQCLKECRGSSHQILSNNECVSSCSSGTSNKAIPAFSSDIKYANNYCLCDNVWYYNIFDKINVCSTSPTETCSSFYPDSKYIITDTKQCVISCPENYPYIFNSECLHQCEDYSATYDITTVSGSKKCQCRKLWKYTANSEIECVRTNFCPKTPDPFVEIVDTKQCYPGDICPSESPLLFNRKCYKKNNCPENSYYNSNNPGTCTCYNLWYKYQDPTFGEDFIHCLPKETNRCPMQYETKYPYQNYATKECLKEGNDCDPDLYIFNYICYENSCPVNTIEDPPNSHNCICNKEIKYFYEYKSDETNRVYYKCGLDKCEGEFYNLYKEGMECVKDCYQREDPETHRSMLSFRGDCVKVCPEFTHPEPINEHECTFYKLEEASSLEQLKSYTAIQVRELYNKANIDGYLYENSEITLQIYGIDKDNNINNKEYIMKSNLAYIDLGTCTQKIFENNHLSDNDKILVMKYDMKSIYLKKNEEDESEEEEEEEEDTYIDDYYLINPTEYEFYSSVTGEKIDAGVCEPNEIIVSYPISYTLSKFDAFGDGMNKNEYKKKFEIGRDLFHKNNNIDIFNFNNSVYKDICVGVEINGKDLILEDRFSTLYPNNITLCEENCTLNYTDYELGRINCKCTYKEKIVFKRGHTQSSDLLNSPNFTNPTQSGANAEVIKCLSKFPGKDSIIKNEAFYYCSVITLAEISLVFVAAFQGFKAVSLNIINLLSKFQISNFKNVMTSQRILNNPPKKGNSGINIEDEKSEKIGNIINKKNIAIGNNNIYNDYESDNNNEEEEYENIAYGNGRKIGISSNKKEQNNLIGSNNMFDNLTGKAEFMPMNYNFKYFKTTDKGVIKKIERSKLLFEVDPSIKYLLERKDNINYDKDYLEGPFLPNQNIIEIIDKENPNPKTKLNMNINNNNKITKSINNENREENNRYQQKNRALKTSGDFTEKEFISVKKIGPSKKKTDVNYKIEDYNEPRQKKKVEDNVGLFTLIKKEQSLQRVPYKKYLEKTTSHILSIFLAEIMDKIYLLKVCFFLKQFDIFSVHLTLYLLYHLLLLTLLCSFFTIKTIRKIWNEENFPQLDFYLLYGLLANIVIWVVYKIFACLLDVQDKVKELVKLQNTLKNKENKENKETNNIGDDLTENNNGEINEELIQQKYDELMKTIKIRMIVFFVISFLLTIFCYLYLLSFFAIYTGTKSKVLKAYLISLIEIILIKAVYGIVLASLRIAAEGNEIEKIYKIVYICDKYIS